MHFDVTSKKVEFPIILVSFIENPIFRKTMPLGSFYQFSISYTFQIMKLKIKIIVYANYELSIDYLNEKFISEYVSLDESPMKCTGRTLYKQFNLSKRGFGVSFMS